MSQQNNSCWRWWYRDSIIYITDETSSASSISISNRQHKYIRWDVIKSDGICKGKNMIILLIWIAWKSSHFKSGVINVFLHETESYKKLDENLEAKIVFFSSLLAEITKLRSLKNLAYIKWENISYNYKCVKGTQYLITSRYIYAKMFHCSPHISLIPLVSGMT